MIKFFIWNLKDESYEYTKYDVFTIQPILMEETEGIKFVISEEEHKNMMKVPVNAPYIICSDTEDNYFGEGTLVYVTRATDKPANVVTNELVSFFHLF